MKKKSIIFSLLILTALLVAIGIYLYNSSKPQVSNSDNQTINYDPPTAEEKNAGDKQKEKIIDSSNEIITESEDKPDSANILIVDANQYEDFIEVRAFVENVIEDGTCTYTFTKDSLELVKTSQAFADASTTPCIAISVSIEEFAESGEWRLVVNYASSSAEGSAETKLEIEL